MSLRSYLSRRFLSCHPTMGRANVMPSGAAPQCARSVTTRESGAILEEPRREAKFGLLKVFATVMAGLSVGAWVSQKFAAFLEENELFVPEDDDGDDD